MSELPDLGVVSQAGALGVAAFLGLEAEATELIQATMDGVTSRGEGRGVTSQYAAALLYNGLGRYDKALAAAELVCEYDDIGVLGWSLTELVEAAVRSGQPARASDALQRLSETTRASGTDWALGTEARSRALLSEGQTAENCYREAIERLGRTRMRPAVARAPLSTRTVEWHLGKVYTKLGVGSRRELPRALASLGQADPRGLVSWVTGAPAAGTSPSTGIVEQALMLEQMANAWFRFALCTMMVVNSRNADFIGLVH